jgi:Lon protease-like protein
LLLVNFPLFPLNTILFPGGLLPLRIFEPRYLDMVSQCIKTGSEFGVVGIIKGSDVMQAGESVSFAEIGTVAHIIDFDVPQTGLMNIRCIGTSRFRIKVCEQHNDGLWVGDAETITDDQNVPLQADLKRTAQALGELIDAMRDQGIPEERMPVLSPYRLDDCGWVANRWCEILPIPMEQKQNLLELDSPLLRLELVNDMFISHT